MPWSYFGPKLLKLCSTWDGTFPWPLCICAIANSGFFSLAGRTLPRRSTLPVLSMTGPRARSWKRLAIASRSTSPFPTLPSRSSTRYDGSPFLVAFVSRTFVASFPSFVPSFCPFSYFNSLLFLISPNLRRCGAELTLALGQANLPRPLPCMLAPEPRPLWVFKL